MISSLRGVWLFLLGLVILSLGAYSQQFNNSWINYSGSQRYYKFKVWEKGIYRIDATTLTNAGIPLSTVDPRNFQLIARGNLVLMHIEGENDGVFDPSDYIEFYAEGNDGWNDSTFFGGSANQPNPHYSLINDTIYYFLTWNTSVNQRLINDIDTNFTPYTPVTSFIKEELISYTSDYFDGETNQFNGTTFGYHETEGWFDRRMTIGPNGDPSRSKWVPTKNALSSGTAEFQAVVLGESNSAVPSTAPNSPLNQHLRISLGTTTLFDTLFQGYQKIDVNLSVSSSSLGVDSTEFVFRTVDDMSASAAGQAIAFLRLRYPHTLDMEGRSSFEGLYVNNNTNATKSRMIFTNFVAPLGATLYDLTNGKRIKVVQSGANFECLIPNSALDNRECYLTSESDITWVAGLEAVNGTGLFSDYASSPIDTGFIIITHPSLIVAADAYVDHRNMGPGNNPQNAKAFDINDLYDQFAYGIQKHPYAIRGFMDYIVASWPDPPLYLFLVGKSIKAKESRKDSARFYGNLVPSFGVPASDNMLTSGLQGTSREPLVPTGRLAAKNGTELKWYLNKVVEYENPSLTDGTGAEEFWRKRILHFGGGVVGTQGDLFKSFLNNYKATIEDTLFGGNVISFFKNTTAPIQNIMSDTIRDYIEQGTTLMTFFGHASATGGFDQNIDNPADWPDQQGRYPLVTGFGCFAGDLHIADASSTSEQYVILGNKGAIGFLASVDLGIDVHLNNYASKLYDNMAHINYGKSIGNQIKNTIIQTQGSFFADATASSITLHGDPSLRINTFPLPDYMIEAPTITFNPEDVTSDIDSFDINVLVTNLGRAINDTIVLEVVRDFPDQAFQDTTYVTAFPGTNYQETISFRLPVDIVRGLGINTFTITVDAINAVVESFENNNTVTTTLNIRSGELIPIYPYEYMIVPEQGITLSASTAFPFEPAKDYLFELDTTDLFNSPFKQTTTINHPGGIISWTPTVLQSMPDSAVYFWRVSKDSVDATGYSWRERSFQYIPGKEGWEQEHFFQFKNDQFQFVEHNSPTRTYNFVDNVKELRATNFGAATATEWNMVSYYLDTDLQGKNGLDLTSSIHVAVIDSLSLEPWSSNDLNLGQLNNNSSPNTQNSSGTEKLFIYRMNSSGQMDALENLLRDTIDPGHHVLMWSWYTNFSSHAPIPVSLRTQLGNMGAVQFPVIGDSIPFILYMQKGDLSSVVEVIGDSIAHKNLNFTTVLRSSANFANIFSEVLGPAVRWDSLSWRMNSLESPTSKDSTVLNVYGIDAGGNETLLINSLPTDSGDIRITTRIDASTYPYLKLNAYLSDDSLFTSPQLDRWHVIYDGVPEAALDPSIQYVFQNDTVDEGQDISMSIAVKNISRYNMDSLLISFAILDKNNNITFLPYARQKPLLADSILIATINFSTIGYAGVNSLLIDVNPNNDQLEKYHFNNVAQIPFFVNSDKINPILDVTFDGIHILDGDIVSPKATVVIELTDENQLLLLNDTSDYAVYITDPTGVESPIRFFTGGVERMQFIPASLPKNNSKIIFEGDFELDGGYKLRVRANDRSQNSSGIHDYIIGFEVINRSTITNIVNYPNPFTTSTRFVFTLTGSVIPDVFKIQIMTITGKVVREIHKDELGPINIGRNISQFAWDGTDRYGDRLANGLYLYHVVTQINNESIELRETSADYYFKKGFGKMYLFR